MLHHNDLFLRCLGATTSQYDTQHLTDSTIGGLVSSSSNSDEGYSNTDNLSPEHYFTTLQLYRARQDVIEYKKISQEKVAILYDDRAIREKQYRDFVQEHKCTVKEIEQRLNT
jgi:hypothetical protein